MHPLARRRRPTRPQRGGFVVELAIVLPLLVLLLLGAVDIGRGLMVQHSLEGAARAGCRLYTLKKEATEQDVRNIVDLAMTRAGLRGYSIEFTPTPGAQVAHMQPVSVTVSIDYNRVAWLPGRWFMAGKRITAQCVMPADTGEVWRGSR